ncbi:MAG: NAD(P)H-hydrate dehydratase [Oscillospiraceae bacterium]|nr:NAD(P)H-hydrate dehydratase [Oscillospiraceae bacterium]
MIQVLSVENMRKSDLSAISGGTAGKELMLRAARGIFESVSWKGPVAIVCGSGNNAGDGYALALLLKEHSISCSLFLISEKFSEDGKYYFDKCIAEGVAHFLCGEDTSFCGYNTIVDCIFGTGFSGDVSGKAKEIIEKINLSNAFIVSADINSGLNGNSGMGKTSVISDITVSIGSFKPGHFLNAAKDCIKKTVNADIGIPPIEKPFYLIEKEDAKKAFPERKNFSNKSTYGYIALIGGSAKYAGAIFLASLSDAAMRSGAGVSKIAAPKSLLAALMPHILESTLFPLSESGGDIAFNETEARLLISSVKAIAFGMGIGLGDGAQRLLAFLLKNFTGTLIIDADGLTLLSKMPSEAIKSAPGKIILTPHNMEFSRLSGHTVDEILNSPIALAKTYAEKTGAVLLLKGPTTVITDGQEVYLCSKGCPGMATAGSGDVLSGILAALCGYNSNTLLAAYSAAFVNGLAGELAQKENGAVSMTAGDTVRHIPEAVKIITGESEEKL